MIVIKYPLKNSARTHQDLDDPDATLSHKSVERDVLALQFVSIPIYRIPAFLESHECEVADELIKSYKKGDSDRFLKWTTKP
jgi:hypothetical protein